MEVRHVIFDWDGTLLDSAELVLSADNAISERFGWKPVGLDYLRENLTREWRNYYNDLRALNNRVHLTEHELSELIDAWTVEHQKLIETGAKLIDGVGEALDHLKDNGLTQSICSMQQHDRLCDQVKNLGLTDRFLRIDGLVERDNGSCKKADHLAAHLSEVRQLLQAENNDGFVMVGDTIDDAHAAAACSIPAHLVATGENSANRLRGAGVPVHADLASLLAEL